MANKHIIVSNSKQMVSYKKYVKVSDNKWILTHKRDIPTATKNLLDTSKTTKINDIVFGLVHSYDKASGVHNIRGNFTGNPYNAFNVVETSDTSLYGKDYKINIVDISGNTIPNDFRAYGLRPIDTSGQMAVIANWVTGTFYDISFRLTVSVDPMTEYIPYQKI